MKNRKIMAVVLVAASALFTLPAVYAEGPMNEDLTAVAAHAKGALAASQANDSAAFAEHASAALAQAKVQMDVTTSPRLQRIAAALKSAVNKNKKGDMAAATESLNEALDEMK